MRLIDADALKHSIIGSVPMMPTVRIAIERRIDDMTTVDAVPVVRCKDCALLSGGKCKWWNMIPLSDNWFCADGEKERQE